MTLNLNGIEIELPNNAKVDVSKDGKKVKIEMPEATEKIHVVEVAGKSDRVVERIKVVEVEKPCNRQHYPNYPQFYPYKYDYGTTMGSCGTITESSPNQMIWPGVDVKLPSL